MELLEIIRKYKFFYDEKTKLFDEENCLKALQDLKTILKYEKLIHIFKLGSDENSQDIEIAILKVFLMGRALDFLFFESIKEITTCLFKHMKINIMKT